MPTLDTFNPTLRHENTSWNEIQDEMILRNLFFFSEINSILHSRFQRN